jgi:hypothetical protein
MQFFLSNHHSSRLVAHVPVIVYSVLLILWCWPFVLANQIVAPQQPYRGGMQPTSTSFWHQVTSRPPIYGDFPNQEVGEIALSLTSPKSGVLAIWTNQSGHGRALFPHFAYTESTFTTWLAARIGGDIFDWDVYQITTLRNLALIYVAGLFLMLYGIQLKLNHWASMLAGFMYATAPPFSAWIVNYPFMVSGSIGIIALYAIHRLTSKPHVWVWLLLAWAIHIQITSAYLQHTIYLFYMLAGYTIIRNICQYSSWQQRWRNGLSVSIAFAVGIIASMPMLVDLYTEYQFSVRALGRNAQANVLPLYDIYRMTSLIIPDLYGVKPTFTLPIEQDFQLLNGRYFTWLATLLIMVGSVRAWRQVWGWIIWLIVAFTITYIPAIHDIGFNSIFPQISAWSKPFDFATLHLPSAIIMMWGIHYLFTSSWRYLWVIGLIGAIVLLIALWSGQAVNATPRWAFVAFEIIIVIVITLRNWWQSSRYLSVLIIAGILSSALVTFPTIYRQAHADMYLPSELHQIIATNLEPNRSLVEISTPPAEPCCFVRGNENIMFQIPTMHVYRSNISAYYTNLIRRLGGRIVKGTVSNYIQPRYDHPDFWMLNVGVVVSYQPQTHPSLAHIITRHKLHIYRNIEAGAGCCLHIPQSVIKTPITTNTFGHQSLNIRNIRKQPYQELSKIDDAGDTYTITNPTTEAAIIVLNHVYHPKWYAHGLAGTATVPLETIVINDVYQGVLVPNGITKITMEFTPWSRWMWIVHWIWVGSAIIIAGYMRYQTKKG